MTDVDKKGPPRFLFLEFLEPEINGLLSGLRKEFSVSKFDHSIHLTVRGPYSGSIPFTEIEKNQNILDTEPLLIHGAGKFDNRDSYVVYIKVHSEALRKIWWKPDFPIEKFGFNPHITLYKGKDEVLADKILLFLQEEQITLACHQARLAPFASKQGELFAYDEIPIEKHFLTLSNNRNVRADILQRAARLISNHRKSLVGEKY